MTTKEVQKRVAGQIVGFVVMGQTHLNTERGLAFIDGLCAGLRACGHDNLADALSDFPAQENDELVATINHWYGGEAVTAQQLPDGKPFNAFDLQ